MTDTRELTESAFAMHMRRKRQGFDASAVPSTHHRAGYRLWNLSDGNVDYWLGADQTTKLEDMLRACERTEALNQHELDDDSWECAQMGKEAGLAAVLYTDDGVKTMWEAFLGLKGDMIEFIACSEWD